MTCIVGVADSGRVVIGGDSAGVAGLKIVTRADAKVFRNGKFVFGFTTSFRMGQILRYSFQPPKRHPETDVMTYMVTEFIDGIRSSLKAGGFAKKDSEVEQGGTFLVGYEGRLFRIEGDYQVGEPVDGVDSCGCGEEFALGAMHALRHADIKDRATAGLQAAADYSAGVRGPFHFETLDCGTNDTNARMTDGGLA